MKRFLSIALGLLILFFQLGLSFSIHYCGGKAVSYKVSLGTDSPDCGMEKTATGCKTLGGQTNYNKSSCCKNKTITPSLTETVNDGVFQWYSLWQIIPTPTGSFYHIGQLNVPNKWAITDDPPDVGHHIRALHQVFII